MAASQSSFIFECKASKDGAKQCPTLWGTHTRLVEWKIELSIHVLNQCPKPEGVRYNGSGDPHIHGGLAWLGGGNLVGQNFTEMLPLISQREGSVEVLQHSKATTTNSLHSLGVLGTRHGTRFEIS